MALYKRANSDLWHVRFRLGGKEYRRSTGTKVRRRAVKLAEEFRAEIERQAAEPTEPPHAPRPTEPDSPSPEPTRPTEPASPPTGPATTEASPTPSAGPGQPTLADLAEFDAKRAAATGVSAPQQA